MIWIMDSIRFKMFIFLRLFLLKYIDVHKIKNK